MASIIWIDIRYLINDDPYLVVMSFEVDFNSDEFFNLFKIFKLIVTCKFRTFDDCEISEEIIIDDIINPSDL